MEQKKPNSTALAWNWAYLPYLDPPEKQEESALRAGYIKVVSKSEADKVIALLKVKANYNEEAYKLKSEELADTCRFYEDELRHQKYKRCFGEAKTCLLRHQRYERLSHDHASCVGRSTFERWRFLKKHYEKWYKRWLALAEEPTWAKFLQLIRKEAK